MLNYFFLQHSYTTTLEKPDECNFLYHINTFDWPQEHTHQDYWEFTIVTNGTIINHVKNSSKVFKENSVLVSRTDVAHYLLANDKKNVRYINFVVRESFLKNMLNSISPAIIDYLSSEDFSLTLTSKTISEIEKKLLYVNYALPQRYKENDLFVSSAFMLLLSEILISQLPPQRQLPSWVIELNKLIQNDEILKCSVDDLSKYLGYSCPRITSLFKKQFGITPHTYIANYKFDYARKMLLHTDKTIGAIAETLGFNTPMQFYTIFKKKFGVTPNEYRKIHSK